MFRFILIFANLLFLCYGSCPFMQKSLQQGTLIYEEIAKFQERTRSDGIIVSKPEPGWPFYYEFSYPDNVMNAMHNSTALLIAEQYYDQQYLSDITGPHLSVNERLQQLRSLSKCVPLEMRCKPLPKCNPNLRYRTIDGTCNNLKYPNYGSSYTQYLRMLQGVFNDGLYDERKNVKTSAALRSAREIGNEIFVKSPFTVKPKPLLNVLGVIFGQLVAHDVGYFLDTGTGYTGKSYRCCSKDYTETLPKHLSVPQCESIDIPRNDPFYSQYNMTCMNFLRSQVIQPNNCQLGQSQKLSITTGHLDASFVYGHTEKVAMTLRSFQDGKLKMSKDNILYHEPNCTACYIMGDKRQVNNPVLLVQQSIFVRFHNYIAGQLSELNKHWNDERLYQEARRILIAVYQHIVTDEWLAPIIGEKYFNKYFNCQDKTRHCGKYDKNIKPGVLGEFSSASLRFFHALIPNWLNLNTNATHTYKSFQLSDVIKNPVVLAPNYLGILQGALFQEAWLNNYPTQLRNHAFKGLNGIGFDISAYDIARGRDFGLPPYYQYMELCEPSTPNIQSWSDLEANISPENIEYLKMKYDDVHDVDLLAGIFVENKDGYLGPVGRCIFGVQFYRFIYGDRFYYTFKNNAYPLTEDQLKTIYNINYAQFICQVTDVKQVPWKAHQMLSRNNKLVNCDDLPNIDLSFWKDQTV